MSVVPHRFLFRYQIAIPRNDDLPGRSGSQLKLSADSKLPNFDDLDSARPFAELRAAWNQKGIAVRAQVTGKKTPFACDPREPTESDGLQIWINTRPTQAIHRASRFCHHFCFLSAGGGKRGDEPAVIQVPIALARENAPTATPMDLKVHRTQTGDGYLLEAWIAAEALHGYDPEANPKLGFYYALRDAELGEQFLSVGRELPIAHDPSLWATLDLVG